MQQSSFAKYCAIPVHLYGQPTNMRKSYDGLQALARHAMDHDPLGGALYTCTLIAADFASGDNNVAFCYLLQLSGASHCRCARD
jgi:hypothetical protein